MRWSAVRDRETQRSQDTRVFDGDDFLANKLFARHYGEAKILEIGEGTTDVQPMADVRDPGFSAI